MDIQWKREWTAPAIVGAVSFISGVVTTAGASVIASLKFRKNQSVTEDSSVVREFLEEFKEAQNAMDIRAVEQNYRMAHTLDQVKVILKDLKNGKQRTLDDYAREVHASNAINPDIFPPPNGDWDYHEEAKNRSENQPYILHRTEFFANEREYPHSTLTYYEGDDVLCDEQDVPIYGKEKLLGELKFGHGSEDPEIVYIRNDERESEYEVLLDHGHYQVEVLGQEIGDVLNNDLKHAHIRKFRME